MEIRRLEDPVAAAPAADAPEVDSSRADGDPAAAMVAAPDEVPGEGPTPEEEVDEETQKKRGGFFSFFSRKSDASDTDNDTANEAEPEERDAAGDSTPENRDEPPEAEEEEVGEAPAEELQKGYPLKTGDRIDVTLTGPGGLSEELETVIDEKGRVKLRYIGAVEAEGLTTTELENEIEAEYTDRQKIYKQVVARVVVPNTFYFIGGEVRQPGRFPLPGRVTLSQAIPAAGNFTEWANERKIVIARGNDRYVVDFREIARDPTLDVELQPGDVITVERRSFL